MLTVGSLFAGIGGIELGLERTGGFKTVWQVEKDDYARRVLEKHWPNVRRWDDVCTWPQPDTERVDLICGGPPCQPVSFAGKRQGASDERWMWDDTLRIIRELEPQFVLLENPPALLSFHREFGNILGTLAEGGLDAEWQCIPAGAFGAHFRGERLFILASRTASGCLRRKGRWGKDSERADCWGELQFAGLVERELQNYVPSRDGNRIHDGVSHRVDRLRCLGNAVVPQVAEWIGYRITATS